MIGNADRVAKIATAEIIVEGEQTSSCCAGGPFPPSGTNGHTQRQPVRPLPQRPPSTASLRGLFLSSTLRYNVGILFAHRSHQAARSRIWRLPIGRKHSLGQNRELNPDPSLAHHAAPSKAQSRCPRRLGHRSDGNSRCACRALRKYPSPRGPSRDRTFRTSSEHSSCEGSRPRTLTEIPLCRGYAGLVSLFLNAPTPYVSREEGASLLATRV